MQAPKTSRAIVGAELFGHGLDWWNAALLISLAIAALAALAVVAATAGVIVLQKREAALAEWKISQLRNFARPREFNRKTFAESLENKPKSKTEIWYTEGSDTAQLAVAIYVALSEAGWPASTPVPIPDLKPGTPLAGLVPRLLISGAQPTGVTVVAHKLTTEGEPSENLADSVLMNALRDGLGSVNGGRDETLPADTLRIVIAPKPDLMALTPDEVPMRSAKPK